MITVRQQEGGGTDGLRPAKGSSPPSSPLMMLLMTAGAHVSDIVTPECLTSGNDVS